MKTNLILLLAAYGLFFATLQLNAGTKIKGVTGQEVEFSAIFDASTEGLVVLVAPDSTAITVAWSKIDMIDLKIKQPNIYSAYEKALATQKIQPIGLGLAESLISLSQLKDAMKQAIKDPNYWPYGNYGYSYSTTTTGPDGQTSTRNYSTTVVTRRSGYISTNTPYIVLKQIRDAKSDAQKKELLQKIRGYGLEVMIERMDSVLEKIPPPKMFKRSSSDSAIVGETIKFKSKMRDLLEASSISPDDQSFISSYFRLLEIN